MGEVSGMYPNLSDQTQFTLNKINEIKDYFIAGIRKIEAMNKGLSKYIDKALIVLSATSGGVSIASFASVIGVPVGIAGTSFSFTFSVTTGIITKLLKTTRDKKKKHNKTVMMPRSKLNSIETMMSKVLIDSEISHKEYATIINEEEKYRRLKEDTRMVKSQRNDAEKDKLIKESKRIGINKIIWQNNGKASSQKKFFFKT